MQTMESWCGQGFLTCKRNLGGTLHHPTLQSAISQDLWPHGGASFHVTGYVEEVLLPWLEEVLPFAFFLLFELLPVRFPGLLAETAKTTTYSFSCVPDIKVIHLCAILP